MTYYLASKSPRRKELLKYLVSEFEQISPLSEEHISKELPIAPQVASLALQKAQSVSEILFQQNRYKDGDIVIAADTVVYLDELMLKPRGRNDAIRMLHKLRGNVHKVITAVAVIRLGTNKRITDISITDVFFRNISDEDIEKYVDSGEPMDKAGAYGIQGLGSKFIEKIDGDFYAVMGLPLNKLDIILRDIDERYGK